MRYDSTMTNKVHVVTFSFMLTFSKNYKIQLPINKCHKEFVMLLFVGIQCFLTTLWHRQAYKTILHARKFYQVTTTADHAFNEEVQGMIPPNMNFTTTNLTKIDKTKSKDRIWIHARTVILFFFFPFLKQVSGISSPHVPLKLLVRTSSNCIVHKSLAKEIST